jgi:AraC family transcriptional regulator
VNRLPIGKTDGWRPLRQGLGLSTQAASVVICNISVLRNLMKPHLFPEGSQLGSDNLVLHASSRRHVVENFPGPLSIKSVIDGQVTWTVDGRDLVVDTNSFLILNDGQKYSMSVDMPRPMETCCAFFRKGFVEQIGQDATSPLQASLDAPSRGAPPLHFVARLHTDRRGVILPRLRTLAERCNAELQPSSFEEDFLILSKQLLALHKEIRAQIARVPAAKASTREELFRRLQVAKEYIHSSSEERMSLETVAREACLSRYHLHRAFKEVFRQTPHGYLTALRLERARSLLKARRKVIDVCMETGFTSTSSFTRLFRSHFGYPPSEIRKIGQASR